MIFLLILVFAAGALALAALQWLCRRIRNRLFYAQHFVAPPTPTLRSLERKHGALKRDLAKQRGPIRVVRS